MWKRCWVAFALLSTSLSSVVGAQSSPVGTLLIAYDTRTGNTERLANAIGDGAREVDKVDVRVKGLDDVEDEDILSARGILLGSPVHWGSASAATKTFLERIGSVLVEAKQIGPDSEREVRTAGAFVTAGAVASGKELARFDMLAAFLNMQFVVIGGEEADGFGNLGAQATTGPADPGLSEEELEEARRFGRRFAELTLRLRE